MNNRNRNTAIVLIVAGLFVLLEEHIGFFTLVALVLLALGIHQIRTSAEKSGYILLAIGILILFGSHFTFIVAIVLLSLGLFYIRSKNMHRDGSYVQKQKIIESLKWNDKPWIMKNASVWHIIGEVHIDLALAIPEQQESVLVIQGVIGDVDILVPEDMGVSVVASAFLGQIDVSSHKDSGVWNKFVWQSDNYEKSENKVKLVLSYMIADIDVKIV